MNKLPKSSQARHQIVTILTVVAWAIGAFIFGYAATIGSVAVLKIISPTFFGLSQNVLLVAVSTLLYVLMLAVLLFVPRLFTKRSPTLRVLGLERGLEWKDVGLSLPAIVIYFVGTITALYLATRFLPWIDADQVQKTGFSSVLASGELFWVFFLLVFVGPIIEEVIFRGYLYGKIRAVRVPFWLTMIIVSVLFGIAHMQWNVGIDTFVLSMVMCVARELTGSIWTGILMHMIKNGLAFYFLFIAGSALSSAGMLIF